MQSSLPHLIDSLEAQSLIPLVTLHNSDEVSFVADCLLEANIPFIEIALRNAYGMQAIADMSAVDGISVGAGTVLSEKQAVASVEAGAAFLVSPGLSKPVLDQARALNVPYLPGIYTPSEIQYAMEEGLRLLKLFPAEIAGGPSYLKALSDVYPGVRFMPSGGVTAENLSEYLSLPNVFAVSGSWLFPRPIIEAADVAAFRERIKFFREVEAAL